MGAGVCCYSVDCASIQQLWERVQIGHGRVDQMNKHYGNKPPVLWTCAGTRVSLSCASAQRHHKREVKGLSLVPISAFAPVSSGAACSLFKKRSLSVALSTSQGSFGNGRAESRFVRILSVSQRQVYENQISTYKEIRQQDHE
jgi:hypothetical protein